MQTYTALGIMSGTSSDGLDMALCRFEYQNNRWTFKILKTGCYAYPDSWKSKLQNAQHLSALEFIRLHKSYGKYIGQNVNNFLKDTLKPDFTASHGHTIFHQPEEQLTCQIGDGAFIAAETGITNISDFRTQDTALGGQGAPLVPVGDKYLFADYDFCLNIGGFANVSYQFDNQQIAYDICPTNFVLNELATRINPNLEYDKDGQIGKSGKLNTDLSDDLNRLDYYSQNPPKSLGREFVEQNIFKIFDTYNKVSLPDVMRTFYEHIALQIENALNHLPKGKLLITGGGAHNKFLIDRIKSRSKHQIIIPTPEITDFKEALIFAFLGVLRMRKEENCLASVTGAKKNNIGGQVFFV